MSKELSRGGWKKRLPFNNSVKLTPSTPYKSKQVGNGNIPISTSYDDRISSITPKCMTSCDPFAPLFR